MLRRAFALSLSIFSLVACSGSDESPPASTSDAGDAGGDTSDAVSGPVEITVDTFNVGLAGAFVPNEAARRPKVVEALAADDADVVCLQEVWFQSDKEAIANAVKDRFPYTVSFQTDLSTPIDDRTDLEGNTPPVLTTAPCADPTLKAGFEGAIECLKTNCNTMPGSDDGMTTNASCPASSCVASVASLLGADDKRCYGCLLANIPASTFANMKTECETNPNGGLSFSGQNGVMILSKHPLSDPAKLVLPATWAQRIVARATATLPNGAAVDVYCNHLAPIFKDSLYVYTGQWGGGETDIKGWENENLLHAKKLIAWQETRGDRRAIVLGDMNASPAAGDVEGYALPTLAAFDAAYTQALVAGYTPVCTFCKTNPNTDGSENTWLDHVYLEGIPASAVKESQRIFTDAIVDGATGKVPLSDHYGFRVKLEIAE